MMRTMLAGLLLSGSLLAGEPKDAAVGVVTDTGNGSGIVVRSGDSSLVLTNKHVVAGKPRAWVLVNGELLPASRITVSEQADLAGLLVGRKLFAVDLADEEAKAGDEVMHFGRSSGPSKGRVIDLIKVGDHPIALRTSCLSLGGDSGCGVLNAAGRLTAINWGRMGGPADGSQLGVRLADVKAFVKGQ